MASKIESVFHSDKLGNEPEWNAVEISADELVETKTPTAGGQYHWVSEFSPRWCQKYLSYLSGWLLAIGWQGSIVSLSFVAGTIVQGLISLHDATYEPQQWHGTLLIIAAVAIAIAINVFLAKMLPMAEILILILHVVGLFAIIIPLLAMAPKNSAKVALLTITNDGGWSSTAEEVKNASETLPRAILWGATLNAILGYVAVLTLCFTMTDIPALLATTTGYPFLQLLYNVTQSFGGTAVMAAIVIITLVCAVVSEVATASRQVWAFSRDDGFPFSKFLRSVSYPAFGYELVGSVLKNEQVKPGWNIPLNALWVSFGFGIVIALINLGSSVALNAVVSLTISALISSYIVSIGCLLSKRLRGEPLPPSRFSLGRWGMAINITALIFLVPLFFFLFFPTATPVDPQTMNWNVVMFGGITVFATVYYVLVGRKVYRPPVLIQNRDV
ncbi:MAG: hypothetical protein Q9170_003694 [Blastenia crenularia]